MTQHLSRRDFLKVLSLLPPWYFMSKFDAIPGNLFQDGNGQNVLVIVFDTFSAEHLSFLGYPRETTPNLTKFVERATVYHNHYSGGNWTAPGTATLLTGTYPWTHRAFNQQARIDKDREKNNIFNVFDSHYRIGYSHNSIVDRFLRQFSDDIDFVKPQMELFLENDISLDRIFSADDDIASLTWDRIIKQGEKGYTYSPILARLYAKYSERNSQIRINELQEDFPYGLPRIREDDYFLLEDGIDWLTARLETFAQPFLGYFHFLPPHSPYNTRKEFLDYFRGDGVGHYIEKPKHLFSKMDPDKPVSMTMQRNQRRIYDEFILYTDSEFGRLVEQLESGGFLENTWIVFTSDHGEMFERGIWGHRTPALFQPVIQIPLVIMEPGQRTRRDVFTSTSAVDVLPTMLKVTGHDVPAWVEGEVLSPFSDTTPDEERRIYAVEATNSEKYGPLSPASVMMVKGKYKLTYYSGYEELGELDPYFELYDLENDPEEMNDIYQSEPETAKELRDELLQKIAEVDKPYQK